MTIKIAIQPDEVIHPNGERQSFSERWIQLARERDVEAVLVDAFAEDAISQIVQCDAFMWRYPSSANPRLFASRLVQALEQGAGMPVFPCANDAWFYEDKIAQAYFFEAAGIPHAKSCIFWAREAAQAFCDQCKDPFVLKLASGHQSANVRLIRERQEAGFYVDQMFSHGATSLAYRPATRTRRLMRRLRAASEIAKGHNPYGSTDQSEQQYGYFYAQQFLPGNTFEISVIIIGHRAFACRRFVRPGDFRTRGSAGDMDWDPDAISEDALRLAYTTAQKLGAQTVAIDILHSGSRPIVVELTVNYASWVVSRCPGYWRLEGEPANGTLTWVDHSMRAEDAIFDGFLGKLRHSNERSAHHAVVKRVIYGQHREPQDRHTTG